MNPIPNASGSTFGNRFAEGVDSPAEFGKPRGGEPQAHELVEERLGVAHEPAGPRQDGSIRTSPWHPETEGCRGRWSNLAGRARDVLPAPLADLLAAAQRVGEGRDCRGEAQ